ncbi:hypothetical protein [Chryseobacterium sp. 18068]|uniref:hypothetical protein n=1 Tax=Chryseobacterium sp. 18068 TaxID=2681414 RepID=UPI00135C4488|nr:hypothetical protein [Chryseobacterium sp. 18068]
MKKIFVTLTIVGLVTNFKAQIKVINTPQFISVGKVDNFAIMKKVQSYQITYQDIATANLNTYRTIRFDNKNKDFENLREIIIQGLELLPEQDIILEFPSDIVYLHFEKNFGKSTVQFIQLINKNKKYIGKSNFLSKEDILKVFGEKKIYGK